MYLFMLECTCSSCFIAKCNLSKSININLKSYCPNHCDTSQCYQNKIMENSIKLKDLNCIITCKICGGYFVDAATIKECVHTFCKSCLVKHLEVKNTCPTCAIVIHHSHPLKYIGFDQTIQDIVFKIVPGFQLDEIKREREFNRIRGLPFIKNLPANIKLDDDMITENQAVADSEYHRTDEQVNIELEYIIPPLKSMKKKFLRVSSQATITHLKKFIAVKIFGEPDQYNNIDILCSDELLRKDHTLKLIYVTKWRFKNSPLKLQCISKLDL